MTGPVAPEPRAVDAALAELLTRMRDDAVANGDYEGAAELQAALSSDRPGHHALSDLRAAAPPRPDTQQGDGDG